MKKTLNFSVLLAMSSLTSPVFAGEVADYFEKIVSDNTYERIMIIHDKVNENQSRADEAWAVIENHKLAGTRNGAGQFKFGYDGINVGDKDFSYLLSNFPVGPNEALFCFGGDPDPCGTLARAAKDSGAVGRIFVNLKQME